jgi:hypothetical protein
MIINGITTPQATKGFALVGFLGGLMMGGITMQKV